MLFYSPDQHLASQVTILTNALRLHTLWWQIDENTHQSLIVYPSEDAAIEEMAQRDAMRKETIDETGHKMVEETKGPFLSIMADV